MKSSVPERYYTLLFNSVKRIPHYVTLVIQRENLSRITELIKVLVSKCFYLGCYGCCCRHSLEEQWNLSTDWGCHKESAVWRICLFPLLPPVFQRSASFRCSRMFIDLGKRLSVSSQLSPLSLLHSTAVHSHSPRSLYPSLDLFDLDVQSRGSSHVDVSNRLSVLILIEARIFRTIRECEIDLIDE